VNQGLAHANRTGASSLAAEATSSTACGDGEGANSRSCTIYVHTYVILVQIKLTEGMCYLDRMRFTDTSAAVSRATAEGELTSS
jgi:hypothetical protein